MYLPVGIEYIYVQVLELVLMLRLFWSLKKEEKAISIDSAGFLPGWQGVFRPEAAKRVKSGNLQGIFVMGN